MKDEIKNSGSKEEWQAEVISKLAFAAVNEQRRTRRWGIFFKALFFLYLLILLLMAISTPDGQSNMGKNKEHTALVEVKGVIADLVALLLWVGFLSSKRVAWIVPEPLGNPLTSTMLPATI